MLLLFPLVMADLFQSNFYIDVIRPLNKSIFGSTVFLGFSIVENHILHDFERFQTAIHFPFQAEVSIWINGKDVFRNIIQKTAFDCVLQSSLFTTGQNSIQIHLKIGSGVYTETLALFSIMQEEPCDKMQNFLKMASASFENYRSYLFIHSYSTFPLDRFAILDGRRFEILNLFSPDNAEEKYKKRCMSFGGGTQILHCHPDFFSLINIAYVDHTYIFIEDLLVFFTKKYCEFPFNFENCSRSCNFWNQSDHLQTEALFFNQCSSAWQLFHSSVLEVIQLSRETVWLFVPNKKFYRKVVDMLNLALFEVGDYFEEETILTGGTKSSAQTFNEIVPGTVLFKLSQTCMEAKLYDKSLQLTRSFTNGQTVNRTTRLASNRSRKASFLSGVKARGTGTTVLFESYDVGKAFILLSNACISNDVILLFKETEKSPSILNVSYIAEYDDRGFRFTGYVPLEILLSEEKAQEALSSWPRAKGLSALSRHGVSGGHLMHELEPLTFLLYVSFVVANTNNDHFGDSQKKCTEPHTTSLDETFIYIAQNLVRVILVNLDSSQAGDWLLSVIGCIKGFWSKMTDSFSPAVYLKDHFIARIPTKSPSRIKANFYLDGRILDFTDGVCFDELLLLGLPNAHVTFFRSSLLAASFKKYMLASLKISEEKAQHLLLRERKLRVTIALRAGPHRLLSNFPAIHKLLLDSHLVDKLWLNKHILTMDLMAFNEQVKLMANTDVFITIHGATVMNGIFMKKGSVVIDIFNGFFVEFIFEPILREAGVKLQHITMSNHTKQASNCPHFPPECLEGHLSNGNDLKCSSIRQCSVEVSLSAFNTSLINAYHHILSVKWANFV